MSEATTGGSDLHPYGPGSHRALENDREMPACYPIKGNIRRDGIRYYHRPDSRSYGATRAEVWFDSPSAAEAAGFSLAPTHPSGADASSYEPGGADHPCSVEQVEANRIEAAGGTDRHPYGPGSHGLLDNEREMPDCHPIKGNVRNDGRRFYHRPDSRNYGATRAEVWFDSPSAAEAAGFSLAPTHPSGADPATFEPGGSDHPCTVEQVEANRSAVAALIATGFTGGPDADDVDPAAAAAAATAAGAGAGEADDTADDTVSADEGDADGGTASGDDTASGDNTASGDEEEAEGGGLGAAATVVAGAAGATALGLANLGQPAADTDAHPYGVGSHAVLPNAMDMPRFYPIKGNLGGDGSRRYYRPDSTLYRSTKPEVWFDSPSAAEACGFTLSATHPTDGVADDYEPGGQRHPWSVEDVEGARLVAYQGPDGARAASEERGSGAGAAIAGAAAAGAGALAANRLLGGDDAGADTTAPGDTGADATAAGDTAETTEVAAATDAAGAAAASGDAPVESAADVARLAGQRARETVQAPGTEPAGTDSTADDDDSSGAGKAAAAAAAAAGGAALAGAAARSGDDDDVTDGADAATREASSADDAAASAATAAGGEDTAQGGEDTAKGGEGTAEGGDGIAEDGEDTADGTRKGKGRGAAAAGAAAVAGGAAMAGAKALSGKGADAAAKGADAAAAGADTAAKGAKALSGKGADTVVAAASGAKGAASGAKGAAEGGKGAAAAGAAAAGSAAADAGDSGLGGWFRSGNGGDRRGCLHPVWMLLALVALLLLLALLLSQCGGDDDNDASGGGADTTEAPADEPSSPTTADTDTDDDDSAATTATTGANDIEALALAALADAGLGDVEVEVNDGEITLSGTVDNEDDMQAAEAAVAGLSGVTGVDNALQMADAGVSDDDIAAAAVAALADAGFDGVDVSVSDGVVTLTGEVPDEAAVAAAAAAVAGLDGAASVTNSVTAADGGGDGETDGEETDSDADSDADADTEETPPADAVEEDPPFTG